MLTLAAMTWAAYMFMQDHMQMRYSVPPPVVIERGIEYGYSNVESAITVPATWTDNCYDQQSVVLYMGLHFNSFRNGKQKLPYSQIDNIAAEWKCIE